MDKPPKLEFHLFVINKPPGEQIVRIVPKSSPEISPDDTDTNISYLSTPTSSIREPLRSIENSSTNNIQPATSANNNTEESFKENILTTADSQATSSVSTSTETDTSDEDYVEKNVKRNKTFKYSKEDDTDLSSSQNSDDDEDKENESPFSNNSFVQRTPKVNANPLRRYPKRTMKRVNYFEGNEDDFDDDCYIFCDICQEEFYDGCKIHPLRKIFDTVVPLTPRNIFRARLTLPFKYLRIGKSYIPKAGEGVWSNLCLPLGFRFGPYEGASEDTNEGHYSWEIKKNGKVVSMVDGFDESVSNWMRYVNCARNVEEQNLMAFVYRGKIYYRTVKPIPKNTEILVYYGDDYAKKLNINTKNFHYLSRRKPAH